MLKKFLLPALFLFAVASTSCSLFRQDSKTAKAPVSRTKVLNVPMSKIKEHEAKHRASMLQFLSKTIQYPSVEDYGDGVKPATKELLEYVFKEAQSMGFTTRLAADGMVGILEMGEGDEVVGVLIHMDVVPAGSEGSPWTHPPFSGANVKGEIWGRGAQDNKGALAAILWATKALADNNFQFKRKLRIILGTKEEKNFEGLIKYFKEEKQPDFGIVPDGAFLTRGEKGIADIDVSFALKSGKGRDKVVQWQGGTVVNSVPDFSYMVIASSSPDKTLKEIQEKMKALSLDLGKGKESSIPGLKQPYIAQLSVSKLSDFKTKYPNLKVSDGDFVIHSIGQAAHGSTPWGGRNAIVEVALLADRLDNLADGAYKSAISFASKNIGFSVYGQGLSNKGGKGLPYNPPKGVAPAPQIPGLDPEMYYGTSVNLGLVQLNESKSKLELALNFRTGIGNTNGELLEHSKASAERLGGQAAYHAGEGSHYESFYLYDDNPLLQMLYKSYKKTFPKRPEMTPYMLFSPASTYMKLVKNFSNFGPVDLYPNPAASHFHQKDERIAIEALTNLVWVYAEALQQMIQAEKAPLVETTSK